jgi:hypothetical protein
MNTTIPKHGSQIAANGKIIAEVTTAQFAAAVGISDRYVRLLCEQGRLSHRRKVPQSRSTMLIPQSEIHRFLHSA